MHQRSVTDGILLVDYAHPFHTLLVVGGLPLDSPGKQGRAGEHRGDTVRRPPHPVFITTMSPDTQAAAIDSIGAFAAVARAFVVVAPSAVHKDTGRTCNSATYLSRGYEDTPAHMLHTGLKNHGSHCRRPVLSRCLRTPVCAMRKDGAGWSSGQQWQRAARTWSTFCSSQTMRSL